ncbi:amino acid transporter [Terrilactibacillus sp. BCM23-1]|uniref:Amino acid transporter n=2 Tax=Terrilactibacillus tamarindi TaxID=2599694 RepID=A0A6N8CRN5_9BACI|nr:LysE family transporter [Terrilactibacillus tamarindi]MTT32909.1 amino acid transporter [Terrilactibacillus tamarindi]
MISFVFLGLSLAAPMGPVNSAEIDKGIKNGFFHAWLVGIGAMIADAFFMLLVYLGLLQFLNIPPVQVFLWLFGSFVLIYTGFEGLLNLNKLTLMDYRKKDSLFSCLLSGFLLSISSPLSILFWLGIYGSILAKTTESSPNQILIYSTMIFLGLALWDLFIAVLTSGLRPLLNTRILKMISLLSCLSLIAFGVYFGIEGVQTLLN